MPRNIYDEDHEAMRASAREFVARTLTPRAEEMIASKSIPRDIWLEAGKQGFFGLDIPEEFGGAGVDDYRFNAVVAEEMSRFNAATSSCFGIHSDVCPPYIVDLGTAEQKQRWLPGMASGELICAIAMTEPSGGSDLAALKTTAVRDGDSWILNGSKTFITNGYQADLVIVAARTDPSKGAKGITLLMVERGMEGFVNGRKLDKVGMDESDTAELFFENVRVPDENRLGDEGMGFIAMMQRLPRSASVPPSPTSPTRRGSSRRRSSTPRTARPSASRSAPSSTTSSSWPSSSRRSRSPRPYVDDCVAAHAEGKLSAVDAAKAKWWSSQVQNDVLDACVQLHGGYGFMNEYRVARAWRDARVTKIWAGSNEIMKELIGRDLGF